MITLHHLKNQINGVIGQVGRLLHRRTRINVSTMTIGVLNDFQIGIFALIHPQSRWTKHFPRTQGQHASQHINTYHRFKIREHGEIHRLKLSIHLSAMLNGHIADQILRTFIDGEHKRNPIHFIQIIFKLIFSIIQRVLDVIQAIFGFFYQSI